MWLEDESLLHGSKVNWMKENVFEKKDVVTGDFHESHSARLEKILKVVMSWWKLLLFSHSCHSSSSSSGIEKSVKRRAKNGT